MSWARVCEVNLNNAECETGGVSGTGDAIRTRCYGCGNACCKACSAVVTTRRSHSGRARLCADCIHDDVRDGTLDVDTSILRRLGIESCLEPAT